MALLLLSSGCAGSPRDEAGFDQRSSISTSRWKSGEHELEVDGLTRTFYLDVPRHLQPGAALVFVFHGYTGSAKGMRQSAGFSPLVEKHGFVAVYPQGTVDARGKTFFNVGYAFHEESQVDDVRFAEAIKNRLVRDLRIDSNAVFSTGMSNGGDMSFFLASRPQPFVRSIAPVAGTMMVKGHETFVPQKRLSIFAVHGTDDDITRWNGDTENKDGWGAYYGIEDVLQFWIQGFSLELNETRPINGDSLEEKQIVRHRWWTDLDDTELVFYEVSKGKHVWPDHLGRSDVSLAEEIWAFFDHSR